MRLSRVTWLVLATAMALVSAVVLVATFFVNVGHEPLPRGGGGGHSGVFQVGASPNHGAGQRGGANPAGAAASLGPGGVAAHPAGGVGAHPAGGVGAHPAGKGVVVSNGPSPSPLGTPRPESPTKQQYSSTVQQLNAALRSH